MDIYNNIMMPQGKGYFIYSKRKFLLAVVFSIFINSHLVAQDCARLTVEAKVKNASCGVNNDGAIHLSVRGGTVPYTYQWSNGTKLKDLSGVASGEYKVLVSDASGCQTSLNYTLEVNTSFQVDYSVKTPTTPHATDGSINLEVRGGKAPYTFFINDYSDIRNIKRYTTTQSHLNNLDTGSYQVDVRDATGCIVTLTIHLTSQIK